MQSYISFLKSTFKLILSITLVPGILILLFWLGLGIDFGMGEQNEGGAIGLFIVLPASFLLLLGYWAYTSTTRRKEREFQALKQAARDEIMNERYTTDQPVEARILNILDADSRLSVGQIAIKLGIDEDIVLTTIRDLLSKKLILQTITGNVATFSKIQKG